MNIIVARYKKEVLPHMKKSMAVDSDLAVPRILKVVLNSGVGRFFKEPKIQETIAQALTIISGQKAQARPARKSIASFKLRQGVIIGYRVTLRGKRMYDFLDRFINVVLPRTRDFRGLDPKFIDNQGNLTIGIREHTVFPELVQENIKNPIGLEITVVTNAKDKVTALEFLRGVGFPFKK